MCLFRTNTLTYTLVLAATDLLFPFSIHIKCNRNIGAKEEELVNLVKFKKWPPCRARIELRNSPQWGNSHTASLVVIFKDYN